MGADRGTPDLEHRDNRQRRGLPDIVGVWFEGYAEDRDLFICNCSAEGRDDPLRHLRLASLIRRRDGLNHRQMYTSIAGRLQQCARILREAGATIARPGM